MAFDIDRTLEKMRETAMAIIPDAWPNVGRCIDKALSRQKVALRRIVDARITGAISDEDMREHLRGEQLALESAFRACNVRGKATSEMIANAMIAVMKDAIGNAIIPG